MALISFFVFLVCILLVGSQCNSSNSSSSQTSKWANSLFRKTHLTTNSDFPYLGLFLADDGREAQEMWDIFKTLCEDEQRSSCANHGRPVSFTLIMIGILPPTIFLWPNTILLIYKKSAANATQSATLISTPPHT